MTTQEDNAHNMTAQQRFDACRRLAELKAGSFYDRRRYDWKITLGFWALLASTIFYLDRIPNRHWPLAVAVLAAVFLYILIWLRGVWVANENDKNLSDFYMKQAEAILRPSAIVPGEDPKTIGRWRGCHRFLCRPQSLFQAVTSLLLGALVVYVLEA